MRPPHIKEQRKKMVRKLIDEGSRLWSAKMNLGYLKLDKPIRHGVIKHLVLRDDISRRKDASVFEEILKVSGIEIWGRDEQHADKLWERRRNKDGHVQYPGVRKLSQKHYKNLSDKAAAWYEGFEWYYSIREGYVKRYYCKVPSYFFVPTYSKAFITKMQVVDPTIESRMAEIDQLLNANEYYAVRADIWGRYHYKAYNYHKRSRRKIKQALTNYDDNDLDRRLYDPIA